MNSTALRDYTDMMHMEPLELSRYARDCAKQGVMSSALLKALADQLEALAKLADQIEALKLDLEEAEARADSWREEAQAIQRQLDAARP